MFDLKAVPFKSVIAKIFACLIGLFVLISLGAFTYNQLITTRYAGLSENQGIITVTGSAFFKATATESTIYVYLKETAPTSKQAKDQVAELAQKVLNICDNLNINKKDINSGSFGISPQYTWENKKRIFKGYQAYQNITIKIHNTETAEKLLGHLADNGITNVNYSSHINEQELEKLQAKAKEQAIKNARQKAQKLASALGVHLGKLVSFSENGDYGIQPQPITALKGSVHDSEKINPHLPTGEQQQKVTVTLKFKVW